MLSLFSRPSVQDNGSRRRRSYRKSSGESDNSLTAGQQDDITRGADRELMRFPYPKLESGMTDHITSHGRGDKFNYVALTNPKLEEKQSVLRRLITFQPPTNSSEIDIDDAPQIELYKSIESFPLSQVVNFKKTKKFILINSVTVSFVPLMSFNDEFTTVKLSIYDGRKLRDPEVRSYSGNSNISFNTEMSLDYCFPTSSASQIKLTISCENQLLQSGQMWGMAQVVLKLKELDFPEQTSVQDTEGVLRLPDTALDTFIRDPKHLNAVINNEDLHGLKVMKKQGDIVDSSRPNANNARKITLAGTAYGGGVIKGGSDNESIINDIKSDSGHSRELNWANNVQNEPVPEQEIIEEIRPPTPPKKKSVGFSNSPPKYQSDSSRLTPF